MRARLLLLVGSLILTAAALEIGFRSFYRESDGFLQTRAAKRWMASHWGPENRFGFRDPEYDLSALGDSRRLFVVGDSLVAGHGIERREDRFADRLSARLGPDWALVAMAVNGWGTADELSALARFPLAPDILVFSYYLNDITDAAARHGRQFDFQLDRPGPGLVWLTRSSDLADFLYWRVHRALARGSFERYWDYLVDAFAEPTIWADHERELRAVQRYAEDRRARLAVVVFPNLLSIEASRPLTARVAQVFRGRDTVVLDLGEQLAGRTPRELVVNRSDAHPSVALHREVADWLYERLATPVPGSRPGASPQGAPRL